MPKKLNPAALVKDNKDILFDILSGEGVDFFEVSFDGSGDSGQIEDVGLDGKILKKNVPGVRVSNGTRWDPQTQTSTPIWQEDVDVRCLAEGVCYDILEESFGGWEINDGAYGVFKFDVKKRKVTLEFNERIMESKYSEYNF